MKKSKMLLLAAMLGLVAVFCAGSICAFADTQADSEALPHLVVIGCAEVCGEADECILSGCIEAVASDMNAAEKKCSEILAKVREAFQPYGEVNENHYGVYPLYETGGYTATRFLSFATDKTGSLNEIREALAAAGVCRLDGIEYRMKDDSELKLQALRQAVENARQKAAALGSEGKLVHVEEISCFANFQEFRRGNKLSNCVTYTASVRAIFETKPQKNGEPAKEQQPA